MSCDEELEVTKTEKMKAEKRRQILTKKTVTKKLRQQGSRQKTKVVNAISFEEKNLMLYVGSGK